jgi:hypothetical protein
MFVTLLAGNNTNNVANSQTCKRKILIEFLKLSSLKSYENCMYDEPDVHIINVSASFSTSNQ